MFIVATDLYIINFYHHIGVSPVAQWLKKPDCNAGDTGDPSSIPGSWRYPGRGHGNPLQYSCLENPVDREAWQAVVHGVPKRQTWLKQLSTSIVTLIKAHSSHWFSLYCTFYGFDKRMMSCIHPYNILQNSFIALNIPCAQTWAAVAFFFPPTVSIVCFFSHKKLPWWSSG